MSLRTHCQVLAGLYLTFGIVGLTFAVVMFIGLLGYGLADGETLLGTLSAGTIGAVFFLITAIPSLVGAVGLLKRKTWARPFVLGLSFLNLLNIPFGTVLGVYGVWVLLRGEATKHFTAVPG